MRRVHEFDPDYRICLNCLLPQEAIGDLDFACPPTVDQAFEHEYFFDWCDGGDIDLPG